MTFLGNVYRKDDLERRVLTGRNQGKMDCGRTETEISLKPEDLEDYGNEEQDKVSKNSGRTGGLEAWYPKKKKYQKEIISYI